MKIADFYKKYFHPGLVSTDSRKIEKGSIFIALRGDNFNGNDFAKTALQSGAIIAVVDEEINTSDNRILVVKDTLLFLQKLAQHHRTKISSTIIGLTGSNGKTTTKELIHHVLSEKYKVQSTKGNLNNHIGVPLTLLSIEADTDYSIIEMGANHKGEIKALCEITLPESGLITNIGKAHLEGFGSFEGVIQAKSELYKHIAAKKGKFYFNGSDPILWKIAGNYRNVKLFNSAHGICNGKVITSVPFLITELTDIHNNTSIINSHLHGDYNLINILAAACIGLDLGIPLDEIKSGIEKYYPSNFRSQVMHLGSSTVIMDCYNANPISMELALKNAANIDNDNKIAILGSMKELGKYSNEEHNKLVKLAESYSFEQLILFGEEFKNLRPKKGITTNSFEELTQYLNSLDLNNSLILVKGSRANRLERLEAVIRNYFYSNS